MFTFDERIGLTIALMTGFIFWLIGNIEKRLTQKMDTITQEVRTLRHEVNKQVMPGKYTQNISDNKTE